MAIDRTRKTTNAIALGLAVVATAVGLFFLAAILVTLIIEGFSAISPRLFLENTPPPGSDGGLLNAIFGSLAMTAIAIVVATPIGILAGTYLSEYSRGGWLAVQWPVGLGAKGSEGVANTVKQTAGGIGYDEYAYAAQNKLSYAVMKNAAGKIVAPTLDTFAAAAANADWANAKNFNVIITNQPGDNSWPIAASTWVLIHTQPEDAAAAGEALKFFDWAYKNGQVEAKGLDYVAIPDPVVKQIEASWSSITSGGKPVFAAQ